MNHIELFAGCGGLCLGLYKAGFSLTMANELSPMAAETFAYNFLGEDLQKIGNKCSRTLWLTSAYSKDSDFDQRLRENPFEFPDNFLNSDLREDGSNIDSSLVVGNINTLIRWMKLHPKVISKYQLQGIDLVSGGPPCQSFSLAGLREKNNAKNSLPWSFAEFVSLVKPRCVLLENVTGILRPFTENGQKYHAWFEVSKAFASIGFVPLTLHINAKYAGVAQNRPRFIMIGLREDEFQRISSTFNLDERNLFESSKKFFDKVKNNEKTILEDLTVHDLNKEDDAVISQFKNSFLSPLCKTMNNYVSVKDAIGDLSDTEKTGKSYYVEYLENEFSPLLAKPSKALTCDIRQSITSRVKRRYRIYQVMNSLSKLAQNEIRSVISGKTDTLSAKTWKEVSTYSFLKNNNRLSKFKSKLEFVNYLLDHKTKKQTQRAINANEPAPAALSIPDDACHYSDIRTLTAREMARIQSFPDSFVFRSKLTTGGTNRRFEVPVYTQIGNAVPVLLAYALGQSLKRLLER